ncbi:MAG: HD domain-containing phosphohydrolase [Pontibacterium sp.]
MAELNVKEEAITNASVDTPVETTVSTDEVSEATEKKKWAILCVDDETSVLRSLRRTLKSPDYDVTIAPSAKEGLEVLASKHIDVIISDMRMPEMNGADFLTEVANTYPDTIRFLLTGYADIESTIRAVNQGRIHRYLQKPWDHDEIHRAIEQELQTKKLEFENKQLASKVQEQNRRLRNMNSKLEEKVAKRTAQIRQAMERLESTNARIKENNRATIRVFYNLLSLNENLGGEKSLKISELCKVIGSKMGMSRQEVLQVHLAGLLNDLGLLCMDTELLMTPVYDLTPEQLKVYKTHPQQAYAAMAPVAHLSGVGSFILHQYEHFAGTGVPDKLAAERIPLGSRILAVARDYVLAIHGVTQKARLSRQGALDTLGKGAGQIYDPEVYAILPTVIKDLEMELLERDEKATSTALLKPGMKLSRDVLSKKHLLLLPTDTVLTNDNIERLRSYEEKEESLLEIFVLQK